jgi:hypothetical protein
VLKHFKAELEKGQNYNPPRELEPNCLYELEHSYAHLRPSWARTTFKVCVEAGQRFDCECGLFGHFGILCGHVIRVSDLLAPNSVCLLLELLLRSRLEHRILIGILKDRIFIGNIFFVPFGTQE